MLGGEVKFSMSTQASVDLGNVVSVSLTRSLGSHGEEQPAENLVQTEKLLYESLCIAFSDRQWVLHQISETEFKVYCQKVRINPLFLWARFQTQALTYIQLQGVVAKIYKYISLNQSKLGVKLAPVKDAIQMSLQPTDIQRAALASVSDVLLENGWIVSECSQFYKKIKPKGLACSNRMCVSLNVSLELSLPSQIIIICHARMIVSHCCK
jgi:hypothetical protein